MRARVRNLAVLVALFVLLAAGRAEAAPRVFILWGYGESVTEVRSLAPGYPGVAVGYMYSYIHVFLIFQVQWGGKLVLYSGNQYEPLQGEQLEKLERDFGPFPVSPWYRYHLHNYLTLFLLVAIPWVLVKRRLQEMKREQDDMAEMLGGWQSSSTPPPAPTPRSAPSPVTAASPPPAALDGAATSPPGEASNGTPPSGAAVGAETDLSYLAGDIFDPVNGVSLLQSSEGPRPLDQVAAALAAVGGMARIDALQYLKPHAGCVIAHKLKRPVAEAFAARLRPMGIETVIVPFQDVAGPKFLGRAYALAYTPGVLRVTVDVRGAQTEIPWDDIRMIRVGLVAIPRTDTRVDSKRVDDEVVVTTTMTTMWEENLVTYLFTSDGYVRLQAKGLSYAHLEERMVEHSLQNFRQVLADIVDRAQNAVINDGVRALLENLPQLMPASPRLAAWDEECFGRFRLHQWRAPVGEVVSQGE